MPVACDGKFSKSRGGRCQKQTSAFVGHLGKGAVVSRVLGVDYVGLLQKKGLVLSIDHWLML